ncbi:unnamed protein product, partial [marine sediment metagenome]
MAWIFPYSVAGQADITSSMNGDSYSNVLSVFDGKLYVTLGSPGAGLGAYETDSSVIESNKWQHICVSNGDAGTIFYVNGVSQPSSFVVGAANPGNDGSVYFSIGANKSTSGITNNFYGKITEVSFHNIERSSDYINAQLVSSPIYDSNNTQVDTEFIGIKDDNGDRLNVFKYDVPRDYNYVGGEVICVKNEKNIPSWEEDGTVIYQVSDPGSGQFFISDPDDYVLGEKYYYRLFTKNSSGNVSFLTDSPSLTIEIPKIKDSEIVGAD